jgi:predicted transcriptional regulator
LSTKVMTAHIPSSLADKVNRIAKRTGEAEDSILKKALSEWVKRDEEHLLTLEGLADVDAGRTIDQRTVEAWLNSLGTDNPKPRPQ